MELGQRVCGSGGLARGSRRFGSIHNLNDLASSFGPRSRRGEGGM